MKILVSNDDGVFAPGIRALAKRLAENDTHEVYVVAPDRERSATGHSLTLHKPLRVKEVELEGNVKAAWSTTGTPSDCVKLAISTLLPVEPDLVISGINNGANLGSEILYSGTVAAAMEGSFLNVGSIAVSLAHEGRGQQYELACEFVVRFVECYPRLGLLPSILININVPSVSMEEFNGIAITELGLRMYNDWFEHRHDPRGNDYYWLAGHAIKEGEKESSDAHAIAQNQISITPVSFQWTDRNSLENLKQDSSLLALMNGQNGSFPTKRGQ
ncbi:MAG: 5'/3'-nucleotidase SurE [Candidatus Obscuribacterales bacterium]|nr:5'/3'-nucleotidase SurE [Candidatus Obscuribacterales bacterium]